MHLQKFIFWSGGRLKTKRKTGKRKTERRDDRRNLKGEQSSGMKGEYLQNKKPNTNVEGFLKKELQQSETTVKIKSVRRIQKGGLAITCKREEDLQKLTETLIEKEAITENITTKRSGMRHPSIIIYNVPNNVPMKDVQRTIRPHTKNLDDLKLRFKMRRRIENTSYVILEAPSEALHCLKNLRRIAINCEILHLKEFHRVKHCSTCHTFIHTANRTSAEMISHSVVTAADDITPGSACLMSTSV
ncbi:hypothetical protein HNY73_004902 [Argiope bruennichi]|uniref:Uncharacterized protein n=1 Tax=Argiope bruennichi TaxID=94029 RepID=A0A8T0FV34_ARGBR|nr:hypothetical protein HNY73_004902 [Argiope bruennichi]